MIGRVRSTLLSQVHCYIEPTKHSYPTTREAIKDMLNRRDTVIQVVCCLGTLFTLIEQGLGMEDVNVRVVMEGGGDGGIERYFWRVVEDDYFELFVDNTLEVFFSRNDMRRQLTNLIREKGEKIVHVKGKFTRECRELLKQLRCGPNSRTLPLNPNSLVWCRKGVKDDKAADILQAQDVDQGEFNNIKKRSNIGTSTEEDKVTIEKHLIQSFFHLNQNFGLSGPRATISKLLIADYGNFQEQLMLEALFIMEQDKAVSDITREVRREDTVPNMIREIEQYRYLRALIVAWGFVDAFKEDGSINISCLFEQGYSTKQLWEEKGALIQSIISESGYHYIVFPR